MRGGSPTPVVNLFRRPRRTTLPSRPAASPAAGRREPPDSQPDGDPDQQTGGYRGGSESAGVAVCVEREDEWSHARAFAADATQRFRLGGTAGRGVKFLRLSVQFFTGGYHGRGSIAPHDAVRPVDRARGGVGHRDAWLAPRDGTDRRGGRAPVGVGERHRLRGREESATVLTGSFSAEAGDSRRRQQ